jgi:DNA-binding response OmpR family regulator
MDIDYTKDMNLLLVDDVQVHRFLMASGLNRINPFINTDQASTLEQAIDLLSNNDYQAVISDWNMPGGGGAELVKWMRARVHFRRVPFIMISSNSDNEDIINAFMQLQVDAYVVKPFTPKDLYEKMATAIDKRQKPGS